MLKNNEISDGRYQQTVKEMKEKRRNTTSRYFKMNFRTLELEVERISFSYSFSFQAATLIVPLFEKDSAIRDGIDTKSFHRNCDNKGATIWVAKIKDSTQLIGGYVNHTNFAVYCKDDYGPTMGNLFCHNNDWSNHNFGDDDYPDIGIPANFEVEDYEVFQMNFYQINKYYSLSI
ncbi:hypothetical protein C1645_832580 [Glomus cerebriforme]|uniref:TLDc domain-containing protein n=1 Tax=Glomus cerebriforme TaxID=658196 RepID=A0A397SH47_9GLOM|nr:hypothetical protein C1645_832580 [Glomus cerebriforme]